MKGTVLVTGGTLRIGLGIAQHLRAEGWRVLTTSHRPDSGADIMVDFTRSDAVEKTVLGVKALLGEEPLTALVNNAALFTGPDEEIATVNLSLPLKLSKAFPTPLTVVNILDAQERAGSYGASKRALDEWTRKDQPVAGLRVNGVALGPVLAPVNVHEKAGEFRTEKPTIQDVARAVEFLVETPSVIGTVIYVDGGKHLL